MILNIRNKRRTAKYIPKRVKSPFRDKTDIETDNPADMTENSDSEGYI